MGKIKTLNTDAGTAAAVSGQVLKSITVELSKPQLALLDRLAKPLGATSAQMLLALGLDRLMYAGDFSEEQSAEAQLSCYLWQYNCAREVPDAKDWKTEEASQ